MNAALPLALTLLLALAACDNPKPRPGMAAAVAASMATPPTLAPPGSAGLGKRPEMAGFSIDQINASPDPFHKPAKVKIDEPLILWGFAFDPVAKAPGKSADIVIDGVAHGAIYGQDRPDVAAYFKNPALVKTGFRATLPAGILKPGPHKIEVRVIAAGGDAYFDSVTITIHAK